MRPWSVSRNSQVKFAEGTEVVSILYMHDGVLCRDDRPAPVDEKTFPPRDALVGWWKWTMRRRPPTQKELNERLERLLFSMKESSAPYKDALVWLVCLYLTRKRLMRQNGAIFTHVKSAEVFETHPDAMEAGNMDEALAELLGAIA